MGHYTLTVLLPGFIDPSRTTIGTYLEMALAPYNSDKTTEERILHSRAALITRGQKKRAHFEETVYAEYKANPLAFYETHKNNLPYLEYVAGYGPDGGFPARLAWTDDQIWAHETEGYEPEDLNDNGDLITYINPHGRWDFWTLGGIYRGRLPLKPPSERTYDTLQETTDDLGIHNGRCDISRLANLADTPPSFALLDATHTDKSLEDRWTEYDPVDSIDYTTYAEYRIADHAAETNWRYAFRNRLNGYPTNTWVINIDAHR